MNSARVLSGLYCAYIGGDVHGLPGFARGCVKRNYPRDDFQEGFRDAGDLLDKQIPVCHALKPSGIVTQNDYLSRSFKKEG